MLIRREAIQFSSEKTVLKNVKESSLKTKMATNSDDASEKLHKKSSYWNEGATLKPNLIRVKTININKAFAIAGVSP